MNSVVLIGRLTKDPELRTTESDISITLFTLAVKREFQNDAIDFINCKVFKQSADYLFKYANKGDLVALRGRIQVRDFEASDGTKRYYTEVIGDKVSILSSKAKTEEQKEESNGLEDINEIVVTDDDLPF